MEVLNGRVHIQLEHFDIARAHGSLVGEKLPPPSLCVSSALAHGLVHKVDARTRPLLNISRVNVILRYLKGDIGVPNLLCSHLLQHLHLGLGDRRHLWLCSLCNIFHQIRLIGQSLVEAQLGKISLLLYRLLAWAQAAHAVRALVVQIFLRTSGLPRGQWLLRQLVGSCVFEVCFYQLVVKYSRDLRRLQQALIVISMASHGCISPGALLVNNGAGHGSHLTGTRRICRLRITLRSRCP